ncbi:hypothetical protein GCM10027445_39720 [Amycolatopsis endophytica]|uniref:Flagellar basal body-associated protein FliL n=1 Tax=Amycolatopsis endophytica TaxID=860233 RepID=A0A853B0V3_9PSEU|nr:hypothetical protein [Amycolatopsis endophytica]NYI88336.1 hypothetical protein [Amycolatopsis endophytica]
MSWQDELRRLDADLAGGAITQHQHRKMRDELLAAASGGGAAAPVSVPLSRVEGAPQPQAGAQPQWQSANPANPPNHPQYPAPGAPDGSAGVVGGQQVPYPQGAYPQPGMPYPQQPYGAPPQYVAGAQPHGFAPQQYEASPPQQHIAGAQPQAHETNPQPHEAGPQQPQGQGFVPQGDTAGTSPQVTAPPAEQAAPAQEQTTAAQGQATFAQEQAAPTQGPATTVQGSEPQVAATPHAGEAQSATPHDPPSPFDTEGPTQSVSATLLATSKPTSAPSPADERATDSMRFPSIEDAPTVITNPVPPPSRPLPGVNPTHTGPLPQQQPLPFDPAPRLQAPPKNKKTWLFVTLGVVVVVAMVAAGVWFLRDTGTSAAEDTPTTSAPSSPEAVEARLPTLPGTPSPNNATMPVDQGVDLKLYSREEGQLMKDNGATQVIFRGSSRGPEGYLVLVVPAGSAEDAATITKGLYDHSLTAGLQTIPSGSTDAKTVTGSNSAGQMSGTWYTSGNYAIAIWVSQGLDGNPGAMTERLNQTKTTLTTALPPN